MYIPDTDLHALGKLGRALDSAHKWLVEKVLHTSADADDETLGVSQHVEPKQAADDAPGIEGNVVTLDFSQQVGLSVEAMLPLKVLQSELVVIHVCQKDLRPELILPTTLKY